MARNNPPVLILKIKLRGEPHSQVRPVLRIKLDGQGRLLYWDAETGETTAVDVANIESFLIQPVTPARKAA